MDRIGLRIRFAREVAGPTCTQRLVADSCGMSVEWLRRVENGHGSAVVRERHIALLAEVLGVSPGWLLGLSEQGGPVKRRDFMHRTAVVVGAGVTAGALNFGAEALARNGLAALLSGGRNPERRPAEHYLLIRKTLADSDNLLGPRQVIPTATTQVQAMQRLRQELRGPDLQELLRIQTQFADLLGWLHQDSGEFAAAQFWMDRAFEWAHLSGDGDSVTFVLARKAQLAGDMQDASGAVDVAEAALQVTAPRSRLAAVAATYAAHGHALRGDRAESDRLYDQAEEFLGRAEDEGSPWGRFFDTAYVGVQRARSLAALGDHREAAVGFRTAIEHLQPSYHRDRAVYTAREANAHAGAGEFEHAAMLGMQALSVGIETNSGRIRNELAQLDAALQPASSAAHVTRFRAEWAVAAL